MSVHGSELVAVPYTGEVIDLYDASTERLAGMRDQVLGMESEFRAFKAALDEEIHRRLDHEGTLTLRIDGWKITGKPPTTVEWDVPKLKRTLETLVDNGDISEQAALRALEPVMSYKPKTSGLNALLKQKGAVADAIDKCRSEVPQQRRALVRREG